jgi:hypothetical protein
MNVTVAFLRAPKLEITGLASLTTVVTASLLRWSTISPPYGLLQRARTRGKTPNPRRDYPAARMGIAAVIAAGIEDGSFG